MIPAALLREKKDDILHYCKLAELKTCGGDTAKGVCKINRCFSLYYIQLEYWAANLCTACQKSHKTTSGI